MKKVSGPADLSSDPRRIEAALRLRCPECRTGILYSENGTMHRRCPRCGIRFDREPGYFTGAVWIIFLIATPIGLGCTVGVMYLLPEIHPGLAGLLGALCFAPSVPVAMRYSRSLWMYVDHQMNPQYPGGGGGNEPPAHPSGPVTPVVVLARSNITTSTGETLESIQARGRLGENEHHTSNFDHTAHE